MPPTLHPHLKRGLDFDDFHFKLEDVVEEQPAHYRDSQERAAKRRRVEAIASQYLLGKPPVILSAGLRGPFDNGWENPWANNSHITTRSLVKDSKTIDKRRKPGRKNTTEVKGNTRTRSYRTKGADTTNKAPQVVSPEASRAADDNQDLEAQQRDDSLDEVEVPPPTATLPAEDDISGATELFSANTEKCIQNRSPLTNPFWLRRLEPERTNNLNEPTNNNSEASPTRSRSQNGHSEPDVLQLALPKAPIHGQASPIREAVPIEYRSSASASMIISSPAKVTSPVSNMSNPLPNSIGDLVQPVESMLESAARMDGPLQPTPNHLVTPRGEVADGGVGGVCDTGGSQHMRGTISPRASLVQPSRSNMGSPAAEVSQSAGHQIIPSIEIPSRPTRTDIQRSAERFVDLMSTSSASIQQPQRSSRKDVRDKAARRAPPHDLVASPAPASSTGFVYRKIGTLKRHGENTQMSKVRVVNFDSSLTSQKDAHSNEQSPQTTSVTLRTEPPCTKGANQADVAEAEGAPVLCSSREEVEVDDNDPQGEQQDLRYSHFSRVSELSTQAAMLLAQIEFQEDTFPTMSDTSRIWSQPQSETPRSVLPEPSPAITPLSVFSAQLDKCLLNESGLRGPPMSTQDLFDVASPFAFSTVKKRPGIAQRSSLRLALHENEDVQSRPNATPTKSPTPSADRIPLKAKNTTTTLWSFVTEKASQASQDSMVDRTRRSIRDVELPQLDFHTSLDDFGTNGDLHFTDRFLRNLDDS